MVILALGWILATVHCDWLFTSCILAPVQSMMAGYPRARLLLYFVVAGRLRAETMYSVCLAPFGNALDPSM